MVFSTCKNNRTPDLQKTKSVVVNQKREKLKFTSLIISLGTAAIEWFLIMKLLSVQLYSLQSIKIMHFDCASMFIWPLTSAKHGVPAVQMHLSTCLSCTDLRLEFGRKTIADLSATS